MKIPPSSEFCKRLSGYAIFQGKAWGRNLYIGWTALGAIGGVVNVGMNWAMALGFAKYVLFVFLLTRKSATQYFKVRGKYLPNDHLVT